MRLLARHLPCLLLAATAAALALPAGSLAAGTLHVDAASAADPATCGTAQAPCRTLDDAMLHATGGEQVFVAPGSYAGATITVPVHLQGTRAGSRGADRGVGGSDPASTIRSTLVLAAGVHVDGFDFEGIAAGPAIRIAAPVGGGSVGASVVTNSTFTDIDGVAAIQADVALDGLTVSDSLFLAGAGVAPTGIYVHGELVGGIRAVNVERNELRGYSGAAVDAGGTPGLRVRDNRVANLGSLVVLADTDARADRIRIHDNSGDGFTGHALYVGRGVQGVTFERNRLRAGVRAALRLDDWIGSGSTGDLVLRANDAEGFAAAISTAGAGFDGTLIARGNRLYDVRRGGRAVSNDAAGTVDARRNWWGRSSGAPAGSIIGADVSQPLRLVGLDAPAKVLVGGTAAVTARLVGPIGGDADTDAGGFTIRFATTNASIAEPIVRVVLGRATALVDAGQQPGSTTTIAVLDSEQVSATTQVVAIGTPIDDSLAAPSVADSRPLPANGFSARVAVLDHMLPLALSRGFKQRVATNQAASVRSTWLINHVDARRLGLRPSRSITREPFIIARVRTRPIRGTRIITARISDRAVYAIRRRGARLAVQVQTVVRTRSGQQRTSYRRIVLPARVR
jgi:hypothetical protein